MSPHGPAALSAGAPLAVRNGWLSNKLPDVFFIFRGDGIAGTVELWYNISTALPHTGHRKGVASLELLASFLMSVGASVVGSYISKWLDRHRKGR